MFMILNVIVILISVSNGVKILWPNRHQISFCSRFSVAGLTLEREVTRNFLLHKISKGLRFVFNLFYSNLGTAL